MMRKRICVMKMIPMKFSNIQRVGNSYNGFSFEDLRYALARCGYSLHSQYYNPTRDKDGRRTSCQEFLELVESLPDENC